MKMKPVILISACAVVIVSGVFLTYKITKPAGTKEKVVISADYPKYDTLENLADRADTIVKGEIVKYIYSDLNITQKMDSNDEYLNPGGEVDTSTVPYTIYTVKIEKAYKGHYAENELIEVKQPGGILGNTEYVLEDSIDAKLEEGHNYVFFLETYTDSPASLLNPLQASYEYDENNNIINSGQRSESNKINFTMEQLEQMMQQ